MPPAAYALVTTFAALSVAVGGAVTWAVGPRRRTAVILPVAGAFLAFYLVGHRLGWAFGPQIRLYGFDVAIVSDLAFAVLAAVLAAAAQRAALERRARPSA
jgi:hypothetical protein